MFTMSALPNVPSWMLQQVKNLRVTLFFRGILTFLQYTESAAKAT